MAKPYEEMTPQEKEIFDLHRIDILAYVSKRARFHAEHFEISPSDKRYAHAFKMCEEQSIEIALDCLRNNPSDGKRRLEILASDDMIKHNIEKAVSDFSASPDKLS